MENRYKIILSGKNFYKEISLTPDMTELHIGTASDADIRLRRDLFFASVDLNLKKLNDAWSLSCSDALYITTGGSVKLFTRRLTHGDEIVIRYQDSNIDVFSFSFLIDFDYNVSDYDTVCDLTGRNRMKIGGASDCDIVCHGSYLGQDSLLMESKGGSFFVSDEHSKYGVYINGVRVSNERRLEDGDFFSIAEFSFFYQGGQLFVAGAERIDFGSVPHKPVQTQSTHFEWPKFNRNSRIQYKMPDETVEIQPAASQPRKSRKNIIMSLIPSVVMLAMTIVLRGIIGGGGTFVIYSAVSMSIGIIMTIVSFVQEKKEYKKEYETRISSYNEYIDNKKKIIEESRAQELEVRNLIFEPLEAGLAQVDAFDRRLFERSQNDMDFLQVYLGIGSIPSINQVKYEKPEFAEPEDPLSDLPEKVAEQYRFIENAPIVSDFNNSDGIGITGPVSALRQMLKNITMDIAIRHFYNDVKMVFVLDDNFKDASEWIKWLHNVKNARLDVRNIVCDEESSNLILEDLYGLLSFREAYAASRHDVVFDENYIVFITDSLSVRNHPVSKYFTCAGKYGFTFVFLEEYEENIPQGCSEILRITADSDGVLVHTENGYNQTAFRYPVISDKAALAASLKLGAVNIDEVSLETELTSNITMYEMLGIFSVDDLDLESRWASSVVYKSIAAPLGVKKKGEIVYLDISDKAGAHGPHGLVAGTTGSGKSEILQTYILSIATLFHPYEVGFVIIDFKGGGMANQFENLPHLVGTITNIDGREINRSLMSIKAELIKRQEIFSEAGVNHINDYIKLYKEGKVKTPMPHLIMIVDEFAELKAEYPDFMKELISAARIGRTLGVHLILATQKPAGVVDAQIWSNSKFKLCLKVQTKEDSNEVLKTPLAAEIVEPGRAYFQVGNNEIFELFQSAYSGAAVPDGNDLKDRTFSIYERNEWGKKSLVYTNKKKRSKGQSISQLQAIVDYVRDYCSSHAITSLPGICLPSLPDVIRTDTLDYSDSGSIDVPVGIYDDPAMQRQGQVVLDLAKDNIFIVGSAQMGKTVLMQTVLYGLIRKFSPEQVNIYIVDCGSMVLKNFEACSHVGGVVLSNDEEKCKNLFKFLNTTVIARKKKLSSCGVGNYASYLEAGYTDIPLAVVAVDNIAAFKEYFPDQFELIQGLAREAQGVGISFVFTAAQSNALSYRITANFGKKIVLNCNDSGEYSNVFGHCNDTPKEVAGRGLVMIEKRILEYQTAIFGQSEKEADRSAELKSFIDAANAKSSAKAPAIPMVPDTLDMDECMGEKPQDFRNKGIIPVGMDFSTIDWTCLNINTAGFFALSGDAEGREKLTFNLLRLLSKTSVFHGVEATVIDDKTQSLKAADEYGFVRQYSSDSIECMEMLSEFCEDTFNRRDDESDDDILHMLVINSMDVLRKVFSDKTESKNLADAMQFAAEADSFILLTCVENQSVGFNSPEPLKLIKENRQGIVFAPLAENKLFEVSGRIRPETSFDGTMGYRFDGSATSKIKIFK